jgi:hypothetical protein
MHWSRVLASSSETSALPRRRPNVGRLRDIANSYLLGRLRCGLAGISSDPLIHDPLRRFAWPQNDHFSGQLATGNCRTSRSSSDQNLIDLGTGVDYRNNNGTAVSQEETQIKGAAGLCVAVFVLQRAQ